MKSDSHIYVFVNLGSGERPEYLVVPSTHVAAKVIHETAKSGSEWYSFAMSDRLSEGEGWELFGDPYAIPENEAAISN